MKATARLMWPLVKMSLTFGGLFIVCLGTLGKKLWCLWWIDCICYEWSYRNLASIAEKGCIVDHPFSSYQWEHTLNFLQKCWSWQTRQRNAVKGREVKVFVIEMLIRYGDNMRFSNWRQMYSFQKLIHKQTDRCLGHKVSQKREMCPSAPAQVHNYGGYAEVCCQE